MRLTMLKPRVETVKQGRIAPLAAEARRTRGSRWMTIRRKVMARDCGLCQACKRAGLATVGEEVDHVVPISEGGTDDLSNLELLCVRCHAAKSAEDARRGAGRIF